MPRTLRSLALCSTFVAGMALVTPSPALGHAKLTAPQPRDGHADYKDPPQGGAGIGAPCGVAATDSQPHTTLTAGAGITVTWQETVNHPGCFVIDFAAAGDTDFQILGVKSHANPPAASTPRNWTLGVTLPSAPCTGCTLRLRQLMLSSDSVGQPVPARDGPGRLHLLQLRQRRARGRRRDGRGRHERRHRLGRVHGRRRNERQRRRRRHERHRRRRRNDR